MRVLLTSSPLYGHFNPLVPFGRALADAGHEVTVAAPAALAEAVAHAGFRHVRAGLDRDFRDVYPQLRTLPAGPERAALVQGGLFAGVWSRRMAADLLALAARWRPDLVVREEAEYGGCLAAEALGLPHAAIGVFASGAYLDWACVSFVDIPRLGARAREGSSGRCPDGTERRTRRSSARRR